MKVLGKRSRNFQLTTTKRKEKLGKTNSDNVGNRKRGNSRNRKTIFLAFLLFNVFVVLRWDKIESFLFFFYQNPFLVVEERNFPSMFSVSVKEKLVSDRNLNAPDLGLNFSAFEASSVMNNKGTKMLLARWCWNFLVWFPFFFGFSYCFGL